MSWNGCPKVCVTLRYEYLNMRHFNYHFHISFTRGRLGLPVSNEIAVAAGLINERGLQIIIH